MSNPTVLSKMPANQNFLTPIPYKLVVQRTPNVDYFVQKINLPGVSSQPAVQPTMLGTDIPWSGVKLRWNPLFVTYKVNEDLDNWQELFNWITALNETPSMDGYAELSKHPDFTGLNIFSEMTLIVHDNERQPNFNIYFHNAFPTILTDLQFDGTQTDVNFVTASATFLYTYYTVEKVI